MNARGTVPGTVAEKRCAGWSGPALILRVPAPEQLQDVLVDVTPVAPPPRSRRKPWSTVATVAVCGAVWFGVDFAPNFANLGAYRYQPPKTFDGLPLDPKASRAKQPMTLSGTSGVSATAYLRDGEERMVFVVVSEQHIFLPDSELDDLLDRQRSGDLAPTDLHEVDPGDRDGAMKCGLVTYQDHHVATCAWADGSMWGTYTEAESGTVPDLDTVAAHTRDFRHQAEVPS